MTEGFAVWSQVPVEVRPLPSHRDQKIWAQSHLMTTFQRDGSQPLEKDVPGL